MIAILHTSQAHKQCSYLRRHPNRLKIMNEYCATKLYRRDNSLLKNAKYLGISFTLLLQLKTNNNNI